MMMIRRSQLAFAALAAACCVSELRAFEPICRIRAPGRPVVPIQLHSTLVDGVGDVVKPVATATATAGDDTSPVAQLHHKIKNMCSKNELQQAMELLDGFHQTPVDNSEQPGEADEALEVETETASSESESSGTTDALQPSEESYTLFIHALIRKHFPGAEDVAERMLRQALANSEVSPPSANFYHAVIHAWSKSKRVSAGKKCDRLLSELWTQHEASGKDARYVPVHASYVSTLVALSRSRGGRKAAERCEELIEDMERLHWDYPQLAPTTTCVNAVLNAWSKCAGQVANKDAANRSMAILNKMEDLLEAGRVELAPNAVTFNTVLDAVAKSRNRTSAQTAEDLLQRMDDFGKKHELLADTCQPSQSTFNIVMNAWAQSRQRGAARRAEAILEHMEDRFKLGHTEVRPNTISYSTVINAWALSTEPDVVERAEALIHRCEQRHAVEGSKARPDIMMYNSLLKCYSRWNHPDAANKALAVLEKMKSFADNHAMKNVSPDVYTYTTIIDTIAKSKDTESIVERAESVLKELEDKYKATDDERLKPNVRTYTSFVNAIGRSRRNPERADAFVRRMEEQYSAGETSVRPDVVCYNALLNAYGWSDFEGKGKKCYDIYKSMRQGYETGTHRQLKPDVITCNSVLNACAHDTVTSETDKADVMRYVASVFENFDSAAPRFGRPDHLTFAHIIAAATKHMPESEQRTKFAEATFWQCCQNGRLSPLVVSTLHVCIPHADLKRLLGPALHSKEGEATLKFDKRKFPSEWTQNASRARNVRSRPSKKRGTKPVSKVHAAVQKEKKQKHNKKK